MSVIRKFAVFDVDGTFFRSGLYRELVSELIKLGAFSDEEAKIIQDIEVKWRQNRSQESFYQLDNMIIEVFESHLKHLSLSQYNKAVKAVINSHRNNVFLFTSRLAKKLKSDNYTLIAISGSQHELVEGFMKQYGFDVCAGLLHERRGNTFTGQSTRVYDNKHTILERIIRENNLTLEDSIAIGDTAGDIKMMKLVKRAIAFNPDQTLLVHAKENRWDIIVERKGNIYPIAINDDNGDIVSVLA